MLSQKELIESIECAGVAYSLRHDGRVEVEGWAACHPLVALQPEPEGYRVQITAVINTVQQANLAPWHQAVLTDREAADRFALSVARSVHQEDQ